MLLIRVYLPLAFGYFLSYFFRNANAIIEQDLVAELSLSASSLGLLTSAYFISFAAFQLPLGLLLDRFGPRRTESTLLIFAALGATLFALADGLTGLIIGRLLIGFGVSACLMAAFKAYVMWFPPEKLPMINGLQMVAGGLGALSATAPLQWALGWTDWRGIFWALALATVGASIFLWTVHPERPAEGEPESLEKQWSGLKSVMTSPVFWSIAPLTMFSQAAQLAIQGLWIKPWMRDVLGYDAQTAANLLFWMTGTMILGFLGLGSLTARISRQTGLQPMQIALITMIAFMVVQGFMVLEWTTLATPLLLSFSFFATSGILPYAALSQRFPKTLAGRVNTLLNLMVFVCAFIVQWGIGALIDLWPAPQEGLYAPEGYQVSFGILLGAQLLALVWAVRTRAVQKS
ncbi:MAG: MFS transporter [bacterium]